VPWTELTAQVMTGTPPIDPGRAVCAGIVQGTDATVRLADKIALIGNLQFAGVAIGAGRALGHVTVATGGVIPSTITGLGAGPACAVAVDAQGALVRATDGAWLPAVAVVVPDPDVESRRVWSSIRNWLGYCDRAGNLTLAPRRDINFNVLDFGADPTGTHDSYHAFLAWSLAITRAGGGMAVVPPGTYLIGRVISYNGVTGDYMSDVRDFVFDGCRGLNINGYGARLELQAADRRVDRIFEGRPLTDTNMLTPFRIQNCAEVNLEGFEVDGNADKVVEDVGLTESDGRCVVIANCTNVVIRNMRLHHSWGDGINVGHHREIIAAQAFSNDVLVENCEVYANARGNISIHQARHVRISGCRIYEGGKTGSITYSPKHGIDIEPDVVPTPANQFTIIENCDIYNNGLRAIAVRTRCSRVIIRDCFVDNNWVEEDEDQQPLVLAAPYCTLLDSEINTRSGHIEVANVDNDGNAVFAMERCLIRSNTRIGVDGVAVSGSGLMISQDPTAARPPRVVSAHIANNRFINESVIPMGPRRFPSVSHGNDPDIVQIVFRDNYVFIPRQAHDRNADHMFVTDVAVHLAENNVYETDLAESDRYFAVSYGESVSARPPDPGEQLPTMASGGASPTMRSGILVRNERFVSPGAGNGFRPGDNASVGNFDRAFPYAQSTKASGLVMGEQRMFFAAQRPTRGSFQQGDIVINSSVAKNQPIGWICTVGGRIGADAVVFPVPFVFEDLPSL